MCLLTLSFNRHLQNASYKILGLQCLCEALGVQSNFCVTPLCCMTLIVVMGKEDARDKGGGVTSYD